MGNVGFQIKLPGDACKADEIAALQKIVDRFRGSGLYLESLFTNDFSGWCEVKIRDDIAPDLYGWYEGDANEDRQQLSLLQKELEGLKKDKEYFTKLFKEKRVELDRYLQDLTAERAEVVMANSMQIKNQEQIRKLINDNGQAALEIRAVKKENMELKAHLYDLMKEKTENKSVVDV